MRRLSAFGGAVGLFAAVTTFAAPAAEAQRMPGFAVASTITVGGGPSAVAVDPSTHNVYVANGVATVQVVDESGDASTGTVTATIAVGVLPLGVAVDPSNHNVYVANLASDTVSVIDESGDANTGTVTATIAVGSGPAGIAVDPFTHNVYVGNVGGETVSVIDESGDASTGTVTATIAIGGEPLAVAVDPSNHNVYVGYDADNVHNIGAVSVIDESGDANTGTVTATIVVGVAPVALAVDPSTHNVYVGNFSDSTMSVIDESGDAGTGTVTATIAVGPNPAGVAVDASSHNVYVADNGANNTSDRGKTVSVVDESGDASTGTVIATIGVDKGPYAIAIDPSTHDVYVANSSGTVSVIGPFVVKGRDFSAVEGTPFTGAVVARVIDTTTPDSDAFRATVDWGDHTQSSGRVTGFGARHAVRASHTYATTGTFSVVTTVIGPDGGTTRSTSTATVSAPPTATMSGDPQS